MNGIISIHTVMTQQQLADIFTKPLGLELLDLLLASGRLY